MKGSKVFFGLCFLYVLIAGAGMVFCGDNPVNILPTPTDGPQPAVTLPGTATLITGPGITKTATASPTPAGTITPFASPTQEIARTDQPGDPTRAEFTALPYPTREGSKLVDVIGVYTPNMDMNIRSCAAAIPSCYTGEGLEKGERYQFFAMVTVYPAGDIWLCLDSLPDGFGGLTSQCGRLAAYYVKGIKYGTIEIVVPAGR